MSELMKLAEAEIVARHQFFVDWYTGKVGDAAMAETERSFAEDFRMIWPDGTEHSRDPVVALLAGMRGTKDDGYAIRVEMQHMVQYAPDLVLISFDEHQQTADGPNQRRATAVFSPDPGAPGGVVWRHLHQTWIAT